MHTHDIKKEETLRPSARILAHKKSVEKPIKIIWSSNNETIREVLKKHIILSILRIYLEQAARKYPSLTGLIIYNCHRSIFIYACTDTLSGTLVVASRKRFG